VEAATVIEGVGAAAAAAAAAAAPEEGEETCDSAGELVRDDLALAKSSSSDLRESKSDEILPASCGSAPVADDWYHSLQYRFSSLRPPWVQSLTLVKSLQRSRSCSPLEPTLVRLGMMGSRRMELI